MHVVTILVVTFYAEFIISYIQNSIADALAYKFAAFNYIKLSSVVFRGYIYNSTYYITPGLLY